MREPELVHFDEHMSIKHVHRKAYFHGNHGITTLAVGSILIPINAVVVALLVRCSCALRIHVVVCNVVPLCSMSRASIDAYKSSFGLSGSNPYMWFRVFFFVTEEQRIHLYKLSTGKVRGELAMDP